MKRIFKGSLISLGAMFVLSAIAMGIAVGVGEKSALYDPMLGVMVAMFCSSPLPILVAIISGISLLVNRFSGQDKRKNDFTDFSFDDDDVQLDDIMDQLSPEQQSYLENRLQDRELGVGSDGEIVSLDDLFDDDIFKEKRM